MSLEETSSGRTLFQSWSKQLGDVTLGATVIAVVVMMVVPLTPWLIDILITLSLGFSVLLLCLSLFTATPIAFTVFPTLLLVATLFRLALNISSTRLILIRADAGRIIGAFGGYIVGGDIVIGAVIFGILAMVLFLVITKGAERVAEVAARFSLDALPGMQLAIDSDLRLGAISQREAVSRREALDEQSRYFGALDGAMKFVRGDAVAGLVIIVVNIVGGILVGTLRHGLSIKEAIDTYGRLTVGDGLVSMIPALLISTSAGMLVTRVGERGRDFRLGEQIRHQLMSEPRALAAASALLVGLAFVRGLPAWPFLGLAAVFGTVAVKKIMRARNHPKPDLSTDEIAERVGETVTQVVMGIDLFNQLSFDMPSKDTWESHAVRLADKIRNRHGVPLSFVPFVKDDTVPDRSLLLKIRGGISAQTVIPKHTVFVKGTADSLQQVGLPSTTPAGASGYWISADDASLATAAGMSVMKPMAVVPILVGEWLETAVARLVGIDETQVLVDRVAVDRPVLVRETVPKRIALPTLADVLGKLAQDDIHLDLLPEVLETIARGPDIVNQSDLVEHVRTGLAPAITAAQKVSGKPLRVLVLDTDLTSVLESSLVKTAQGAELALSGTEIEMILDIFRKAIKKGETDILVTDAHLRRPLSDLLRQELPACRVLKTGEIDAAVRSEVVMEVSI